MKWRKIGFLFNSSVDVNGMDGYAMGPVAQLLGGDVFRIHYTARDKLKRGHLHFVDIDISSPDKILNMSAHETLGLGKKGCFDDNGVFLGSLVVEDDKLKCYYAGFDVGASIRFNAAIGLATWNDSRLIFERDFLGPIIEKDKYNPYFSTAPFVLCKDGRWDSWFVSCQGWDESDQSIHKYNIEHVTSKDGVNWNRTHDIAIDFEDSFEYAIARPSVLVDENGYHMWFCSRATRDIPTYRIRYAKSRDGVTWERKPVEFVGLDVSSSGWDCEMVCYPHVFDHKGKRYMLYNGNGYGKTGFGLAVLEEE